MSKSSFVFASSSFWKEFIFEISDVSFVSDSATEELGIGTWLAVSLKYWIIRVQNREISNQKSLKGYFEISYWSYLSGTICSIFPTLTNFPSSGWSINEALGGFSLGSALENSVVELCLGGSEYVGTIPNWVVRTVVTLWLRLEFCVCTYRTMETKHKLRYSRDIDIIFDGFPNYIKYNYQDMRVGRYAVWL